MADFVPGLEASVWFGMVASKNTSVGIVERLNEGINAALASPVIKARFADLGSTVFPTSLAEFGKFIGDETEKWGKVVRP
jgi:tripartite-type tricarboxylate transporter receptor subunit TctC